MIQKTLADPSRYEDELLGAPEDDEVMDENLGEDYMSEFERLDNKITGQVHYRSNGRQRAC